MRITVVLLFASFNEIRTCMKIYEYVSSSNGNSPEFKYEFSMNSIYNYRWFNSHIYGIIKIWPANMYFQLVVDDNKVVNYMTK